MNNLAANKDRSFLNKSGAKLLEQKMGGGDLNLKKSWHPSRKHNLERVWLEEQKAQLEDEKAETLRKELQRERELEDLQKMHEHAGTIPKRSERLDWMYSGGVVPSGSNSNSSAVSAQQEDYLLGRKKIDSACLATAAALNKARFKEENPDDNGLDPAQQRDLESKVREDPMFLIRKRELEKEKDEAKAAAAALLARQASRYIQVPRDRIAPPTDFNRRYDATDDRRRFVETDRYGNIHSTETPRLNSSRRTDRYQSYDDRSVRSTSRSGIHRNDYNETPRSDYRSDNRNRSRSPDRRR